jgi:hypothetical protein
MTEPATRNIDAHEKESTTQQLLQLQTTLQSLYSSHERSRQANSSSPTAHRRASDSSSLCEVLVATEKLTNIVKLLSHEPGRRSAPSESDGWSLDNDEDPLVMLHILTCYGYLLRLLEPVVHNDNVGTSQPSSTHQRHDSAPTLSLGHFSLASQPELNSRVTATLIRGMINSLHNTLRPQLDNPGAQQKSCVFTSLLEDTPSGDIGNNDKSGSPMINAASFVMRNMREKEEQVLRRL